MTTDLPRHICRQRKKVRMLKPRKCFFGIGRLRGDFPVRGLSASLLVVKSG